MTLPLFVVLWSLVAYAVGWAMGYLFRLKTTATATTTTTKGRVVKEGDEIFVRQCWTDKRGSLIKHRYYTVLSVLPMSAPEKKGPNNHFVQVDDELVVGQGMLQHRDGLQLGRTYTMPAPV